MSGVQVVLAAWRWVIALWLGELALALAGGTAVRAQVSATMADFALPDDHLMYGVAELVGLHPQIVVAIVLGVLGSAAITMLLWCLLAPLVLLRIAQGARPAAILGAAWLGTLGGALATSGWHLLLRGALAFVFVGSVVSLPANAVLAIVAVALVVATAALDISRAQVVLHGEPGTSLRTALWGWVHAIKHPRLLAVLAVLQLLQWVCAIVGLAIAVRSGGVAVGWARVLALFGTALGLLRMHHVACAGAMPTPPRNPG